ncbi:hypothetical protein ACJMK2_032017 [Sinanodonta woodiana]|uniref:Uncharacterized protein n=1 Tax=Sinanodonta woodiana TaxID=1069815 RepID=A0ABD3X2A3_SINWO
MKTEPPTNIFIEPLVEELTVAWNGFDLKSYKSPDVPVLVRLALLCVGCDIPASRKHCGFLGHSATMGCNKCMKAFIGGIGEKNYGGFNLSEWNLRNNSSHRKLVQKVMKAKTKGSRKELERKYGIRYSVLLELHYFDPVRMTIIDPMHNLFLGSAKHMLKNWNATKILRDEHVGMIQEKI